MKKKAQKKKKVAVRDLKPHKKEKVKGGGGRGGIGGDCNAVLPK